MLEQHPLHVGTDGSRQLGVGHPAEQPVAPFDVDICVLKLLGGRPAEARVAEHDHERPPSLARNGSGANGCVTDEGYTMLLEPVLVEVALPARAERGRPLTPTLRMRTTRRAGSAGLRIASPSPLHLTDRPHCYDHTAAD